MEKIFQWVSDKYAWITSKVPLWILHGVVCFCAALISWEFAVGLALGRESGSLNSASGLTDSIKDLFADTIGILCALSLKSLF